MHNAVQRDAFLTAPLYIYHSMNESQLNDQTWRNRLSMHAGHHPETLIAICGAFLEEVPILLKRIKKAKTGKDSKTLQISAHTLKSCLRYVAPDDDVALAAALEQKAADLDSISDDELDRVTRIANQWCDCVLLLREETSATS